MICRKMISYNNQLNLVFLGAKGVETDKKYAFNQTTNMFEEYDESKIDEYKKNKKGDVVLYPKAVFIDENNDDVTIKYNSYATGKEGVCQSIMQRLSLIQGELFHFINLGAPNFKTTNKAMMDSYVIKTCLENKEVINIKSFNSVVKDNNYLCSIILNTNYGEVEIK